MPYPSRLTQGTTYAIVLRSSDQFNPDPMYYPGDYLWYMNSNNTYSDGEEIARGPGTGFQWSVSSLNMDTAFQTYMDKKGGVTCSPTEAEEVTCDDGDDNDCDGFTDGADPDCPSPCDGDGFCGPGEDCLTCPLECDGQTGGKKNSQFCCGNGELEKAEGDGSICDGNP